MNILENKRVIGISAAFLLAFGGIVSIGVTKGQAFSEAKKKIDDATRTLASYDNSPLRPTEDTKAVLSKATKGATQASNKLNDIIKGYAAFCTGKSKAINSVEFERIVNGTLESVASQASAKGCTLADPAKKLGMAAFTSATSMNAAEVPFRRFQLLAVERVVTTMINSGVASVEKVYCAPLPEDYDELKESEFYFPLSFEVDFTTKRSMETDGVTPDKQSPLARVFNSICSDKNFFIIPTGVSVRCETRPASTDAYQAPAGDSMDGVVLATRKTGSPDDLIRVHMNFQVLYFTRKER